MPSEITMPQLSDTMTEGTVVKWHKKEGDKVKAGEELADVETDKATMPMEAFDSGTLAYIAAKEGEKVPVGKALGVIALEGEDPAEIKQKAQSGGGGGAAPVNAPAERSSAAAAEETQAPSPATVVAEETQVAGRAPASPLARRIATERGVDLSHVQGSGPGGRIVERDVMEYLRETEGKPAKAAKPAPAGPAKVAAEAKTLAPLVPKGEKKVIAMTKIRSAIAVALQRSKQQIPHYYETIDIDMERVLALRSKLNEQLEKENVRLSIADFILKAVASCLVRHPALNARFNAEKGEIVQYGDVNMGIAVAIPDGLIVPVLRGANLMGLREIRIRSADLIERARAQRLRREELSEGTFTISSLGTHGIRQFAAIINPPEVGLLAVGAVAKRAVVVGDAVVPRTILTATLSADHRVVDGAVAAEFLVELKGMLEEPGMMLL